MGEIVQVAEQKVGGTDSCIQGCYQIGYCEDNVLEVCDFPKDLVNIPVPDTLSLDRMKVIPEQVLKWGSWGIDWLKGQFDGIGA